MFPLLVKTSSLTETIWGTGVLNHYNKVIETFPSSMSAYIEEEAFLASRAQIYLSNPIRKNKKLSRCKQNGNDQEV